MFTLRASGLLGGVEVSTAPRAESKRRMFENENSVQVMCSRQRRLTRRSLKLPRPQIPAHISKNRGEA
jgi:hypothetical protein